MSQSRSSAPSPARNARAARTQAPRPSQTPPREFGYTHPVDPQRTRRTHLGHVPTTWLRPRRRDVIWRLLVVALYGASMVTIGRSLEPFDMRLYVAPDDVAAVLEAMGEAGRAEYRLYAFADLGFIVVYSLMFASWLKFLRVRDGLPHALPTAVVLLPALADAVETIAALGLLAQFPDLDSGWVLALSIATPLKWAMLAGLCALLLWGERVRWRHRDDPR